MTSLEAIIAKHQTMLDEHQRDLEKHHQHLLRIEHKIDRLYIAMLGLLGGVVSAIIIELVNHLP